MFLETSRKRDPSHASKAWAPPSYTAEGGMVSKNIYLSAPSKALTTPARTATAFEPPLRA